MLLGKRSGKSWGLQRGAGRLGKSGTLLTHRCPPGLGARTAVCKYCRGPRGTPGGTEEAGRASTSHPCLPQPSSMGVTNRMAALPLGLFALDVKTAASGNGGVRGREGVSLGANVARAGGYE